MFHGLIRTDAEDKGGMALDLEEQLAQKAIAGDEAAFLQLIKHYKVDLYKTALSYLRNEGEAIEAVQEVTYRAFKAVGKVRKPAFFKTWLVRIMINYCNDQLKEKKRIVYDLELLDRHGTEDGDVEFEIGEALRTLDERSRELITLKYIHGLKIKEISAQMECPEGTIKTWLHKALKLLREKLEEKGGEKHGREIG